MIQHEMLAFVSNDFRNASKFFCMFCDQERTRIECDDHPRRINVATFVVDLSCILSRTDRDIWRIIAISILRSIGIRDVNRVIRIV